MGAQDAERAEGVERLGAAPARAASITARAARHGARRGRAPAGRRARRRRRRPRSSCTPSGACAQQRHRRIGVAPADRLGELGDPAAEAVHASQDDDPVADGRSRSTAAPDGVRVDGAGDPQLRAGCRSAAARRPDRRCRRAPRRPRSSQLPGVADQHQPGVGAQRLDQPGHERQRHHRRLVDDHDVVGQPADGGRDGSGCRLPGRHPSRRCSVDAWSASSVLADAGRRRASPPRAWTASSRRAAALPVGAARATSGGGAPAPAPARRAGRRSAPRSSSCRCPGRRPRPRTGAARRRRPPAPGGRRSRAGEQPVQSVGQARAVDVRRRGRRPSPAGAGDLALLAPSSGPGTARMPVSRSGRARRRRLDLRPATSALRRNLRDPRLDGSGHGSVAQVDRLLGVDRGGVADRCQVDEDVAEPWRAHGQRDGERQRLVVLAGDRGQPRGPRARRPRDSTPASVEVAQQAGCLDGAHAPRRDRDGRSERSRSRRAASRPPSSASLSASTSPAGGRQPNTPQGVPSTIGVARRSSPARTGTRRRPGRARVVAGHAPAQVAVQRDRGTAAPAARSGGAASRPRSPSGR